MVLACEVCGNPIGKILSRVEIDGAILQVCQNCSKRGRLLAETAPRTHPIRIHSYAKVGSAEPDFEVDPDYYLIIRKAREKLGLTQEALGRAINVKTSVISHIETKKMVPDMILARTLMHYLKVELLVSSGDLDSVPLEESR